MPTISPVSTAVPSDAGELGAVGVGGLRLYLDERVGFEEGECVEFKSSFDHHSGAMVKYRGTINAFLHPRGGVLYFGIRDDGVVKGVKTSCENSAVLDRFRLWVDNLRHSSCFVAGSVFDQGSACTS